MSTTDYKALAQSLRMIAHDHDSAGAHGTASDYFEAARALDELRRVRDAMHGDRDKYKAQLSHVRAERDQARQELAETRADLRRMTTYRDDWRRTANELTAEAREAREVRRAIARAERAELQRDEAVRRLERVADVLDAWHATRDRN